MKLSHFLSFILIFFYLVFFLNAERVKLLNFLTLINEDNHNNKTPTENINCKLDVPYTKNDNSFQKLDIYFPTFKNKSYPILIHFHGGGWRTGNKRMVRDTGIFYAKKGIILIAPNYRLSPKVTHPTHVDDCALAVTWVYNNAKKFLGDKTRIFISGHSAGAHLAALLGTSQHYLPKYNISLNEIAGIIPIDTATFNLLSKRNEKMVINLIGQAFGKDKNILKEASPFYNINVKTKYPKFLVLNTTHRNLAVKTSKEFVNKLNFSGCKADFIPVDNHTHREMALGMHDESDIICNSILKFILN